MNLQKWIESRRPTWNRFGEDLDALSWGTVNRRDRAQKIIEMLTVYRQIASDLARLRSHGGDPMLIDQLNRLMVRAHGMIYGHKPTQRWGIVRLFATEIPQIFRRYWKCFALSLSLNVLIALVAFMAVQTRPDLVADVMSAGGSGYVSQYEYYASEADPEELRQRFGDRHDPVFSAMVTTNNIRVALLLYALGILLGIGTLYVLIVNAVMVGAYAGLFSMSGVQWHFWSTVLPHGALELSLIVVAGGAGFMLASAIWRPGPCTRSRAFVECGLDATKMMVALIPGFIVAGMLEGFLTPQTGMPETFKVGIGVFVAVIFWFWLLFFGWSRDNAQDSESSDTGDPSAQQIASITS